ncbi:MAG: glycosyltransferase family 4 protein [Desulfobacterales bacterium]|nr:MAG: glycosyltransferase family 4 protein [Desulfobacterales bacterium]
MQGTWRKAYPPKREISRLRICLLSYRSNPYCGGQGVYLKNLSRALGELGHSVEVISGPPDPGLDDGIPVRHLPCLDLYNPQDPFRIPTLKELSNPLNLFEWLSVSTMGFPEPFTFGIKAYNYLRTRRQQYDIVHDNQSLSYGIWAIQKFTPTIATIHHPITVDRDIAVRSAPTAWEKMKQWRWYSFLGMQKQVARAFSHIITVSQSARNDISRDFKIPPERFRIIPNGINTARFHPIPELKAERDRIIVTNSADMPLKGLAYLLRAVAEVSQVRNIQLVVVGVPKRNSHILKLIAELGIQNRIRFTGRIADQELTRHYARASVAVVPSVYEGFGLPAGEAMACGVPVISTTGGGLPEVVGDAGLLVPPADPAALAQRIKALLDNPAWAKALGMAGYKRVQRYFTWKQAAEKTAAAYREAIRGHRRL